MYVVSILAHAELAFNLRRQEPFESAGGLADLPPGEQSRLRLGAPLPKKIAIVMARPTSAGVVDGIW